MVLIKLTKIQKKNLSRFLKNLSNDIYSNDGWIYFSVRMIINCIFLYFIMNFVQAFFIFTFKSHGIYGENLQAVRTILWAIGIMYLVLKGFGVIKVNIK